MTASSGGGLSFDKPSSVAADSGHQQVMLVYVSSVMEPAHDLGGGAVIDVMASVCAR